MKKVKILIAAGGSGGHIFPAIALTRALKLFDGREVDIRFIGSNKALDKRIFEKEGVKYSLVSANKFPYKVSLGLIMFFIKLKIDLIRTFFLVLSYKPDVIIGFGGYAAFPPIIIASLLRIPNIVHEQNVSPGRANKILFRFADKIAVSFNQTRLSEKDASKKVFTGNPIRAEVLKEDRPLGIKRFGLSEAKFTILVIGGSQGAHFLNETFTAAISSIDKVERQNFQAIHLTGVKDYEWALKAYAAIEGLESRVFSFIDRIEEAYSAADLIITRSGASAIFEIAYFGRPMILVPYPFAMSHQAQNAKVFEDAGAAVVIEEADLTASVFKEAILKLSKDASRRRKLGEAARRMSVPNSSMRLAREVLILSEK